MAGVAGLEVTNKYIGTTRNSFHLYINITGHQI